MKRIILFVMVALAPVAAMAAKKKAAPAVATKPVTEYADPLIGSNGWGNCMVTPSTPFALCKPAPDCGVESAKGWLPMPAEVDGFAQTHLSGCGGGPKYGNVLIQPFTGSLDVAHHKFHRKSEQIRFGYYSAEYEENGIVTELCPDDRSSFYRFTFNDPADKALGVDLGFFLGPNTIMNENQVFVGSEVKIESDYEISGYTRIRGGWNKGRAYTIYFYLVSDTPFKDAKTWKNDEMTTKRWQYDSGEPVGANVAFDGDNNVVNVKVGISCLGTLKAKQNVLDEMPHWSFEKVGQTFGKKWEKYLGTMQIAPDASDAYKRMFYTALYHVFQQPVNKTGECPLWNDDAPYYEDFYALWDTFRTSLPLFTIVDPQLSSDIVNSLLTTYKRDKFMPDARSGHCNGRTQGGSNADIVIAEAFAKGIKGIDWDLALEAVLKDADVPPGDNEEAEGRGGLREYNSLGYIPYGIARSCSRTVDYSVCDYAIYNLAKGLGKDDVAERFLRQSSNWKNLWRPDAEQDGVKGFILPKDKDGKWVDGLFYRTDREPLIFTPDMWFSDEWFYIGVYWDAMFYEGTSWIYTLGAYHDVPGMIEMDGGSEAFQKRLDIFFDKNYFDVSNEPSFMAPNLYHWLGRPDRSSARVRETIASKFHDSEDGLPGNDDTGAMSAWLVFNMMGIYPMAGQDYYIINAPLVSSSTINLPDGGKFTVKADGLSDKNLYIVSATLNGEDYPYSTIRHADILAGGTLELKMGPAPKAWGQTMFK